MTILQMNQQHIIGHRGARHEAPENTLGGFVHLRQLNVNKVELDVHLSADQHLMVIHDETTQRTCNAQQQVRLTSTSQLQAMNSAAQWDQWPTIETIPRLEQVLQAWPLLEHIQIEVKTLANDQDRRIMAEQLHTLIQAYSLFSIDAVITSSDQAFLQQSMLVNTLKHGLVADATCQDPVATAQQLGCRLLALDYRLFNATIAHQASNIQLPVSLWTVNSPAVAHQAIALGASSIITDKPTTLLKWIENAEAIAAENQAKLRQDIVVKPSIYWDYRPAAMPIDSVIIHSMHHPDSSTPIAPTACIQRLEDYAVSAHYIISRDGEITQLVAEEFSAWHAGTSQLPNGLPQKNNINHCSIGIELIGLETDTPTNVQYQQLKQLIQTIEKRITLKYILGHSDIAPGRKTDPWNFDWSQLTDSQHQLHNTNVYHR